MSIFYGIEGVWYDKEALRDNVVSIIIVDLNGRQKLSGFNQNQIMEIFQGFWYEIMNNIDGNRGGVGGVVQQVEDMGAMPEKGKK